MNISIIYGDGIGHEVVSCAKRIIDATGLKIDWEECTAGESAFLSGCTNGVPQETISSIERTKTVLKGPLTTPVGYGEKSANVTLRKFFETYANIRPIKSFEGVPSFYKDLDFIIVRENIEDLYAGIEYEYMGGVSKCLKIISDQGCEKIVRMAFAVAQSESRKKIHCVTKSNIMKISEGKLKRFFEKIAPEFPEIRAEHMLVDNCAHQMVKNPSQFDVLVMTNMNGDIISDLSSGLVGGLGFASGANIGKDVAIFEAVHGSAPKYKGLGIANPTAVIMSGVMMLRHKNKFTEAQLIENALAVTFEDGIYFTKDVRSEGYCSNHRFVDAVIENFDRTPAHYKSRPYAASALSLYNSNKPMHIKSDNDMRWVGIDVFIETNLSPNELGMSVRELLKDSEFVLEGIANRGVLVFPSTLKFEDLVPSFQCRFFKKAEEQFIKDDWIELLQRLKLFSWHTIEKLYASCYSLLQGAK